MLKKVLIFVMCLTTLFLFTSCKDTIDPDEYTLIRELGTYEKCSVGYFKDNLYLSDSYLDIYEIENISFSEPASHSIYAYKKNAFGKTKYKNLTDAYESGWLTLDDIETISTSYYQFGWEDENYKYELNTEKDGYIVVKQLNNDLRTIEIPDTVNNLPVVEINDRAFDQNSNIEEVILPKYLKKIGRNAFSECLNLSEIYFPDSLEEIGSNAFNGCPNLLEIYFPESLEKIGSWAFYGCCNLSKIYFPDSLEEIESNAFYGCSMETIELPNKGIRINEYAFSYCNNLKEVKVRHNNNSKIKNQNSDETFYEICIGAFYECDNLCYFEIPNGTYKISSTFANLKMNTITFPPSLKIIGPYAFADNTCLTEIVIPETVEEIMKGAFNYCVNLKSVIIKEGVETIGDNVFSACFNLEEIYIPSSISSIGVCAFHTYCDKTIIYCNFERKSFIYYYKWFGCYECINNMNIKWKD